MRLVPFGGQSHCISHVYGLSTHDFDDYCDRHGASGAVPDGTGDDYPSARVRLEYV